MPKVICDECGKSFNKVQSQINKTKHNFCSHSCAAKITNQHRAIKRFCLACGIRITGKKYCSSKCHHDHQHTEYIRKWKLGLVSGTKGIGNTRSPSNHVRRFLLEEANYKCSLCGWGETNPYTGTIPLEVDHIDGDWTNNSYGNHRVICPNCHALTSTYRGANTRKVKDRIGGNRGDYYLKK